MHHLSLIDVELKEPIGNGSFGKVYRGVYRGKSVAVKRYKVVAFGAKTEVREWKEKKFKNIDKFRWTCSVGR